MLNSQQSVRAKYSFMQILDSDLYLTGKFIAALHKHACTDTRKTIFYHEIRSKERATRSMLKCLKNCKEPWFRQFKEALRRTGKTTQH